jgi:hypothetical protein
VWASVAFLSIEGLALIVGRGNCPMGPLQAEWGDPVPFFELVLPPRAAKVAIPLLAGASIAGFVAIAMREPRPEPAVVAQDDSTTPPVGGRWPVARRNL